MRAASTATLTGDHQRRGRADQDRYRHAELGGADNYTGGTTVNAGTLQLGAGGSLASTGALTVNGGTFDLNGHTQTVGTFSGAGGRVDLGSGALTVTQATSVGYAGVITGSGSLTKTGAGTLTLTGANDYSGGTTVNAGTLAGTTTSLQGNILDNANVTFDQDTNDSTSASISGGGSLTKLGNGTVTLAGAMFYAGGTIISGGALQGTTASLKGAISTATGTSVILVQDCSGSNFSGTITGQGSLIKNGAGTITLQGGPNSYSGGTTINAGSLVGDTTTLQGDITDNATFGLSFDQVTDGSYGGKISGSGGVANSAPAR